MSEKFNLNIVILSCIKQYFKRCTRPSDCLANNKKRMDFEMQPFLESMPSWCRLNGKQNPADTLYSKELHF